MKEVGNKYIPDIVRSYCADTGMKFTVREENYIKLAAEGLKISDITRELRTSQSTIKRMLIKNPNIARCVDEVKRQAIDAVSDRRRRYIDDMYESAIKEVKKLLRDENPWVKMNAIRMVFDRHDKMTAIDKIEDNAMHVVFEGMPEPPTPVNTMIEGTMNDE